MNHIWAVFRFEATRQFRRRAYLFTSFGVPLIAVALLFGYQVIQDLRAGEEEVPDDPNAPELDTGPVGYVDESGLFLEVGPLYANLLLPYHDQDEALAALESGEVDAVFVIEADYLESGAVTKYINNFDLSGLSSNSFFVSFLLQTLTGDVDRDVFFRLQDPVNLTEHRLTASGEADTAQGEGSTFVLAYLFTFTWVFATFFASGYLMQSVLEEKETRMVEILLSTVRPVPLLAGKVLALGLLGFIQVAAWIAAAVYLLQRIGGVFEALSDISFRVDTLVWTVIYFLVSYLFFAGVYAVIGALSPSMREGPQIAAFITLPAMLPFYFAAFFMETPHAPLPVVLSLIPLTAPLAMILRLSISPVPLVELLISVGLLALASVGAIWLAGRVFRVTTLLAGQMPRWRDLVRIVRER